MNSIPASVFLLAIVKLQEFCYKYGYSDYWQIADILIDLCKVDGKVVENFPITLDEIRSSEPFIHFNLQQEIFVYSTFKHLKSGI